MTISTATTPDPTGKPCLAPVADPRNRILGAWKLISWRRRLVETGEESDAFGPDPQGSLTYTHDGRVAVFITRNPRPRPAGLLPTAPEKVALFDSMIAYCGTYMVESDRVIHVLDTSLNELWTGTQQTRFMRFDGDRLVYTTPVMPDPADGSPCVNTVIWQRP